MKVTGRQIRAARALLGLTAAQLAAQCGIQQNTVTAFETGRAHTEQNTVEKIVHALQANGVRLTETGVELTKRTYYIESNNHFYDLLRDIEETLQNEQDRICYIENNDDRKNAPIVIEKLKELENAGIQFKIMSEKGNDKMLFDPSCYRWFEIERNDWITFIFGNKVALSVRDEPRFLVIRDRDLADVMKLRFNLLWDTLKSPLIKSRTK